MLPLDHSQDGNQRPMSHVLMRGAPVSHNCGPRQNGKAQNQIESKPSASFLRYAIPLLGNSTETQQLLPTALLSERLVEESTEMVFGGGAAGDYPSGSMATPEEDMVGKDYVGMSEVSSSSYPGSAGVGGGTEEEEEEELELRLSLGTKKAVGGGGAPWAEYCRILTAEDLPSMGSRASPLSSSSSVSSSSSPAADRERCSGREAKKTSDNPPSQMVVGWPPIRAYRMNSLVNQSKENTSAHATIMSTHKKASQNIRNNKTGERICRKEIEKKGRSSVNSLFVKVNLDGDPIGRKVDLNSHPSYETLALALEAMFLRQTSVLDSSIYDGPRTSKLLDGSSGFIITYEDRDGDWMLVGDVPWGMFLSTVKRLRIMKTSEASGLAPRFHSWPNIGRC